MDALEKAHTLEASPSDTDWVRTSFDTYGLPIALLAIVGFVSWRLLGWMRPKADKLVDSILANHERLPGLIEEARAANAAMLAAVEHQTLILNQLCARMDRLVDAQIACANHYNKETK